jgi:mannose-6-phosphate isomerase-like protein (cupin superfamily)
MRKVILGLGFLFVLSATVVNAQTTDSGKVAFDITKADVDAVLKQMPQQGAIDATLRVLDLGKSNIAISLVHRSPTKGDPTTGTYHDAITEIYIIMSGSGILTTGGTTNKKPRPEFLMATGPGGSATVGPGAYSRKVQTGDIIVIPPGVVHAWSEITDQCTYLTIRPDPERALPGGYVNPAMLKNAPPAVKPNAPAPAQ